MRILISVSTEQETSDTEYVKDDHSQVEEIQEMRDAQVDAEELEEELDDDIKDLPNRHKPYVLKKSKAR